MDENDKKEDLESISKQRLWMLYAVGFVIALAVMIVISFILVFVLLPKLAGVIFGDA
jgi:hypothetical protein